MQQDEEATLPTMLRVGEVAREVGVSERTIYRLMESGGFPRPCGWVRRRRGAMRRGAGGGWPRGRPRTRPTSRVDVRQEKPHILAVLGYRNR